MNRIMHSLATPLLLSRNKTHPSTRKVRTVYRKWMSVRVVKAGGQVHL